MSPWVEEPQEWLVTAHRGARIEPLCRLGLDSREFADAVRHDAAVIEGWWPGGDPVARAYQALLLSFDAALVGIDRTPHAFLRGEDDRLHLTTHHPCPDPLPHLDVAGGDYAWSAHEPGNPQIEEEPAPPARRSRHRRHTYLVLGWLEVEGAYENGQQMDAAMGVVQDGMTAAFGAEVFQRFRDQVGQIGSPTTVELCAIAHGRRALRRAVGRARRRAAPDLTGGPALRTLRAGAASAADRRGRP